MNKYIVEISGRFKVSIEVDAVNDNIAQETALNLLYNNTERVLHKLDFDYQDIDCIKVPK